MSEDRGSTLENLFFGAAFVLFLVVGFFAAKRFGLFPNRPSGGAATVNAPNPQHRFRFGIDDQGVRRAELQPSTPGGPVVGQIPQIKGARAKHRAKTTSVPKPK